MEPMSISQVTPRHFVRRISVPVSQNDCISFQRASTIMAWAAVIAVKPCR